MNTLRRALTKRDALKLLGLATTLMGLALGGRAHAEPMAPMMGGPGVYDGGALPAGDPQTGAMRYSIPFDLPTARGRAQPSLSLSYNSASGDREAGYGWGLSLPTIERRPLTGWPAYDDSDRFVFNGGPLAFVCFVGSGCPTNETFPEAFAGYSYFRAQAEGGYARFFFNRGTASNWIVQLHNGVEMRFGDLSYAEPPWGGAPAFDAEPDDSGKVARFHLSSMRDPYGNWTYYRYRRLGLRGLVYLTDIFDTSSAAVPLTTTVPSDFAHHTQLDWEPLPFRTAGYAHPDRAKPDMRLTRVAVASATWGATGEREIIRGWELSYFANREQNYAEVNNSQVQAPLFHHAFLKEIRPFGRCNGALEQQGAIPTALACPQRTIDRITLGYQGGHFNRARTFLPQQLNHPAQDADGLPRALPRRWGFSSQESEYLAHGNCDASELNDPRAIKPMPPADVAIVDVDRDGRPDIVQGWYQRETRFEHTYGVIGRCVDPNEVGTRAEFGAHHVYANSFAGVDALGVDQLAFSHQCVDALQPHALNVGQLPSLFSSMSGATVLGGWADAPALWSQTQCPLEVEDSFAPLNGCWGNNVTLNVTKKWVTGNGTGRRWAACSPRPLTSEALYVDIDADGYPDMLEGTGTFFDSLERANISFTRKQPGWQGRKLVPFHTFQAGQNTPKSKKQTLHPYYEDRLDHFERSSFTDVNGDGLPDFVSQWREDFADSNNERSRVGPIKVRPGDGRGEFGCLGAKEGLGSYCDAAALGDTSEFLIAEVTRPWHDVNVYEPYNWGIDTYLHDINGDGLADIIQYEPNGTGQVRLWVNEDGHTFRCMRHTNTTTPDCVFGVVEALNGNTALPNNLVTFADMNADGVDDMVITGPDGVWYVPFIVPIGDASLPSPAWAPRPGLLTSIKLGSGLETSVNYQTIQALDRVANPAWTTHSPRVQAVVNKTRTTGAGSPIETSFTYRDPAYDPWLQQFLGFRTVRTKLTGDPAVTERQYWYGPCQRIPIPESCAEGSDDEVWKPLVGQLVREDRFLPAIGARDARYLSAIRYRYEGLGTGTDPFTLFASPWTPELHVRAAPLTRIEATIYDATLPVVPAGSRSFNQGDGVPDVPDQSGAKTVVTNMTTEPQLGLVTQVEKLGALGSTDVPETTVTTHQACREDWQCLATHVTSSSAERAYETTVIRTYNGAGDVETISAVAQGDLALDRSHKTGAAVAPSPAPLAGATLLLAIGYDAFGNVEETRQPGTAFSTSICKKLLYDNHFAQFVDVVRAYPSGCDTLFPQETMVTYDRGLEVPRTVTDPTGAMSEFHYDAWGRVTQVDRPLPEDPSSVIDVQLAYQDSAGTRKVHTKRTLGGGDFAESVEGYNALGELIFATDKTATAGQWTMQTRPNYDNLHRLDGDVRPYRWTGDPLTANVPSGGNSDFQLVFDEFGRPTRTNELTQGAWLGVSQTKYMPLVTEYQDAAQLAASGQHAGGKTRIETDGHGRVRSQAQIVNGITTTETSEFFATGGSSVQRITRTSGSKQVQRTLYLDAFGHVVRNIDPNTSKDGRDWRYVYDATGHLVGTSDARGCGKNIFYDGLGRVLAEDYSPCEAHHAPYTAPDLDFGTGTEAFYRYDSYEVGQVSSSPGFQDEERFAVGRLTSLQDRGAHTRFNYDNRGHVRRTSRRVVKPGVPESTLGTRFGAQWFVSESAFDLGDRLVRQTTGIASPELLAGGESAYALTYDVQSQLKTATSTYGALLRAATYEADGQPTRLTYGDLASTKVDHTYDDRRRLKGIAATRAAPGLWTTSPAPQGYTLPTGAGTTQTSLLNLQLTFDAVSNPTQIKDNATASQWPNGAKPVTRIIGYDSLYRATSFAYTYASSNAHVSPFEKERLAGDRTPVPLRTSTTRVASQTIAYDGLGNITQSTDNLSFNFDRSLGTTSYDANRPDQMIGATGTSVVYDEAGNIVDVRVSRPTGSCSSYCAQQYRYDWDEVGQLQRARRWDYSRSVPATNPAYPGVPGGSPIADLSYAYSGGQRVLKGSSVAGAAPKYAVEVLGTLRLNGAAYDEGTQSYERSRYTETGYMAGFARVEYDPYVPRVQLSPDQEPVHVFLSIGDHLGSTSVVIESSTSEVVEKATFLSHGAIESDYRPTRWQGFREEYKFTGKEEDVEVGLTYFGARYYHARLQRFASPDPLTVHGIAGDLNPYAYVSGRTMSHVDPWGLDKTPTVEVHGVRREPSPSTDVHQAMAESTAAYQAQLQRDPKAVEFAKAVGRELVNNSLPGRIKKAAELAQKKPKPEDVAKGFIRARLERVPLVEAALAEAALEHISPASDSPGEELGKMAEDAQTQWVGAVAAAAGAVGPPAAGPNVGVPRPGIGATGKIGEAALKQLGGESQVFFRTSRGGRYVDQLVNGVAHESKVGYSSLTKGVARQIAKDAELISTGQIRGAVWNFFRSPVTGQVGPSAPLASALQRAGIKVVIH
jgi:RHS repeat-associated protein